MLYMLLLLKVRKKIIVRVNVILFGQFKFFFIFYMEISLIFGNLVFVNIGDNQEIDLIGVGDIMISKIFGDFLMGIDV